VPPLLEIHERLAGVVIECLPWLGFLDARERGQHDLSDQGWQWQSSNRRGLCLRRGRQWPADHLPGLYAVGYQWQSARRAGQPIATEVVDANGNLRNAAIASVTSAAVESIHQIKGSSGQI
jgi:hypothetical protein